MAEDLERLWYYHPNWAHDMWAFGLVLLDLAGGSRSTAHLTACITKDPEETRAYARSMLCLAPGLEYYDQVRTADQTFRACSFGCELGMTRPAAVLCSMLLIVIFCYLG